MNLSVVVPVYNGESSLRDLSEELHPILDAVACDYELILVNDGSSDGSWKVITDLMRHHSWICGINLMRNYGQHNALLCGIRAATYEVVATMDDDLQHPPEELPKLLNKLDEGYDVVYGTPTKEQHGLWRDLASHVTKLILQNVMGAETASNISAFRVFRTSIRESFANYNNPFVSIDVLLTWGAARFAAITVRHNRRRSGSSNYTFGRLLKHALNMMTGFSTLPLQLASLNGFVFMVFGVGILLYVLVRYVTEGGSVPGFPFLASIIVIFSGAQLFALGVIGEYLARMHARAMEKPPYVVHSEHKDRLVASSHR